MGFLDKAKAAASDLAAKADTALASSGLGGPGNTGGGGDAGKYFHDLGVLTYLETTARATDPRDRARVLAALQDMEARGAIRSFALHTAPPPQPGAPGNGPGGFAPPPPPGAAGLAPPPPPPSWMTKDSGTDI